jgi:acetyl-CoA carboxylase carboxyltransferase component
MTLTSDRPPQELGAKLGAHERLKLLCDDDTFRPLRSAILSRHAIRSARAGDGLVCGFGTIAGRDVACYAQDVTYLAGALGEAHAESICRIVDLAREASVPVVSFIESGGARIQEGTAALGGYARIFRQNVELGGVVPQISIVAGLSAGGGCYSPALMDFVVMTERAAMFLTGPSVVREATGEEVSSAALGGPKLHSRNGVCDFVTSDDRSAALLVRHLLSYLPQSCDGPAPIDSSVAPELDEPGGVVPQLSRQVYDVREVIKAIVDAGSVLEIRSRWARNVVTAFARIEGRPVGVIANQPRHIGGVLDVDASQKAATFVDQCDAFGIPMVVLVDTPGFMPGKHQESAGVIRFGATLVRAFASATVPKITVVLRKAFGGAYIAMNSKELGATMVLAWPSAEIGIMSGSSAVAIVNRGDLERADDPDSLRDELANAYHGEHLSAVKAARDGFVDEVIAPAETRQRLVWGLSAMANRSRRIGNGRLG